MLGHEEIQADDIRAERAEERDGGTRFVGGEHLETAVRKQRRQAVACNIFNISCLLD